MHLHSNSPGQTAAIAAGLAACLRAGDVVALRGELGSGKTVFARGALAALGHRGKVCSPTYSLVVNYHIPAADLDIYHFDAYLADKESQFLAEGGAELLGGNGICFVEWPERIAQFLPKEYLSVEFAESGDAEARTLRISGAGERCRELLQQFGDSQRFGRESFAAASSSGNGGRA
ncbi:MAG: tRNA (adenosine(37)-N6)-threonylcarbamoyltransferase complex ATPase subunit type 1 TsaE [Planctomycetes bacterium]|nr:tRNA (adenosine(37)-N6)-threonylcarbamoyltransferase complex ATPase subunit type 1 TsaE [Planctomycetota bacterium]